MQMHGALVTLGSSWGDLLAGQACLAVIIPRLTTHADEDEYVEKV